MQKATPDYYAHAKEVVENFLQTSTVSFKEVMSYQDFLRLCTIINEQMRFAHYNGLEQKDYPPRKKESENAKT